MWFLGWIPYALQHGVDPFVTDQINAPTGVNLMWNSSIPLISLALSPVTLSAGPIVAYNVAMVGSIALSAWCGFVVLGRYVRSTVAALLGGLVYGFSPYVISHAALHLNLAAVWAPPLFLLLLDELLIRRRRSPTALGAAIGLVAAGQLLTAEEILATAAVSAAMFVLVAAAVVRRRSELEASGRRLVAAILPAGLSLAALAGWPLAVQLLGPLRIEGRVQDLETFSTDLLNLAIPTEYQLLSPPGTSELSSQFSGLYHEATAYLGLPLVMIVFAVVVLRWHDPRIRIGGLLAAIMFVLSLGPVLQIGSESTGVPLPWAPFSGLPLLEHALPGRLTLYMWLAVAGLVAMAADWFMAMDRRRAVPSMIALVAAVAVAAPTPMRSSSIEIPPFFERWEQQAIGDDAIILMVPYFTNGAGADAMLWAAIAGDRPRMYEAYAYVPGPDGRPRYGPPPTQLSDIMVSIQDGGQLVVARGSVRDRVARELTQAGITDVIVGPMDHRRQMVAFLTDLFGRPPIEVDGVALWRAVDRSGVSSPP